MNRVAQKTHGDNQLTLYPQPEARSKSDFVVKLHRSGAFVAEQRIKPPSSDAVAHLRQVFDRVWPVDGRTRFRGLVSRIDDADREMKRRRKHQDQ